MHNRDTKDLVLIHNHPSNGSFSYEDLRLLSLEYSLLAVVAIGNNSNLYVAVDDNIGNKIVDYVEQQYKNYITTRNIINTTKELEKIIKNKIVSTQVMSRPDKFRIVYEKYNRRSV